jgi:cell division protein FtsB
MELRALTVVALTAIAASSVSSFAQGSDDANGRYALSPVDGGVLRLDKVTGEISLCSQNTTKWICEPVDDRSKPAGDLAKLEAENRDLRAQIKALEDQLTPGSGPPAPKAQLPTEEEVDKAMDYVESIFKKFRDRIRKYEAPTDPPASDEKSGGQL